MDKKQVKWNSMYGFIIEYYENGTFTLFVKNDDGDDLEFDGKDGNVVISSEPFDEPYISTVDEMIDAFGEMLQDWEIDFDTAQAICKELTPWFERFAISESEAIEKEIESLEECIKGRRNTIANLAKSNDMRRMTIAEQNWLIEQNVNRILEINSQVEALEQQVARLKTLQK